METILSEAMQGKLPASAARDAKTVVHLHPQAILVPLI
jgi:hypothetical protein